VLAPTRELAVQIKEECDKFGASSQIQNTVVYGGVKKQTQVLALRSGVEIVIVSTSLSVGFALIVCYNVSLTFLGALGHSGTSH
jgi:ATP-dependent RNA helicase DDX5/DBP2